MFHFPHFWFSCHIQILQCTYLIFHVFHCFLVCSRSYQCEFHSFLVGHFSHNIQSPRVFSSHFPRFSVFSPYSRSNSVCFSFSTFFQVSEHIHILEFVFLIFLVFQFSNHTPGPTVCISHFPRISVFLHISGPTMFVSYFPRFSIFFPQSSSYSVNFSYLKFFTVSYHIPCTTVCVSHFTSFSLFLAIFHVLLCDFLHFLVFQLSVFSPYSKSYSVCVILNLFPFPCHNPGPTVDISHFLLFSVFLAILHVIQCLFLIFLFLLFSRHNPGPKVFISHI